jgi:hypothetical protein
LPRASLVGQARFQFAARAGLSFRALELLRARGLELGQLGAVSELHGSHQAAILVRLLLRFARAFSRCCKSRTLLRFRLRAGFVRLLLATFDGLSTQRGQ